MSFFHKVKNIFRGSIIDESKRSLPSIIQVNVNPKDSWDIIGELGDGAFGKVEKAISKQNRSLLAAAKAIEVQEGEVLEDFLVEIEILTTSHHPNIVGLYASYYHDNKLHMLLEFCAGGAVDGIMIELEKPLTEPQIAYIAKYLNEALIFLHDTNVIHRDLKAGNILLTHDGIVKLADFGVSAKLRDRNERRDTFIGTPYWMAPEVMVCETFKDQPYTTRSDIWSYGITLIEMAQMEPPHSNVSPMRVLIKVTKSEPPTLDIPSQWSKAFSHFLEQCLVKNPNERMTAIQLASHPFIANATDKRPVLTLLAEMSADVQEEVILDDDRASCDDSLGGSEDQSQLTSPSASEDLSSSWSSPSPAPGPPLPESFRAAPGPPTTALLETPKKRAAPPPPQDLATPMVSDPQTPVSDHHVSKSASQASRISLIEVGSSSPKSRSSPASPRSSGSPKSPKSQSSTNGTHVLSVDPSNSRARTPDDVVSPRREAMNILDDLTSALDDDEHNSRQTQDASVIQIGKTAMPREPWMVAPDSPMSSVRSVHKTRSPLPDNNIRKVVESARSVTTSPLASPKTTRISMNASSSSESVHRQDSFRRPEVHSSTQDVVVKVRRDVAENSSGVGELRHRFESSSRPASQTEDIMAKDTEIPQGHVQNKIRQVLEEQTFLNSSFEAHRIAEDRRQADAAIMQHQPAVAQIAATFVAHEPAHPEPKPNESHSSEQAVRYSPVPVRVKQRTASPPPQKSPVKTSEADYFDQVPTKPAQEPYFETPEEMLRVEKKAPPPEPPVDYDEKRQEMKENKPPTPEKSPEVVPKEQDTLSPDEAIRHRPMKQPGEPRIGGRKNPYRQTVTKKTRTYVIDGMQVTSTTMHVLGAKEDMQNRKQQLQDLRRLQREEARQKQELQAEGANLAEQQEKKFQQEKIVLGRQYDLDMEALERKQKREIEESERQQEEELRVAQKRLKIEQEKDLRSFKERLKQEMKIVKQELDMLPRAQRKEAMKMKKEHMEHDNHMKEADFVMQLQKNSEATLARMAQKHKELIAQTERQFLMQKHLLLRAKENSDWELEEKQMGEKYVLHRKLFKDEYFLLRTQMLARHQKEITQAQKIHTDETDELVRALAMDRKKLPKMLRQEAKTRSVMFKESLRISMQPMSSNEMAERLRRFEEQETSRCKNALDEHDQKSQRKVTMLREKHSAAMRELDEMQNEKRKQLLEKERNTMQEHEKKYYEMREQWQGELAPRKMMLEGRFQEELEAQERFYGISLPGPMQPTPAMPPRFG